jgi:hypothetical protein
LVKKLKEKIRDLALELPLSLAVLFGSYAQGKNTVASDVDVLIVYEGEERRNAYVTVKKTMNIPLLEPHVYSENEYERLRKVIDHMVEGGVVLYSRRNSAK